MELSKVKLNKNNVILLLLFLLSPVFAMLPLVKGVMRNDRFCYFLIAIFFASLSYLMVPYDTMDLAFHYARFEELKEISLLEYSIDSRYFTLDIIMKVIQLFGFNKQVVPFIHVFIIYYLTLSMLAKVISTRFEYESSITVISVYTLTFFFLFFLLSQLRLVTYASGLRNALANSLMIYGIFNLFYLDKNRKGWFFIIFSPIIHMTTLLIIPFVWFVNTSTEAKDKFCRYLFCIGSVLLFTGLGTYILLSLANLLIPYLPPPIAFLVDIYTNGHWGVGFWDNVTRNAYIYERFIKPAPLYFALIYLFIVQRKGKLRNLIYIFVFFISFIVEFRTLIDRYGDFLMQLTLISMLIEYQKVRLTIFKNLVLIIYTIIFIIVDLSGLRVYSKVLAPSWAKVIYLPLIAYPLIDVKEEEYLKSK